MSVISKKVKSNKTPGIIYEDVYYFFKSTGSFTLGVFSNLVVRVDSSRLSLLDNDIDSTIAQLKKQGYNVHKRINA